MNATIVSLDLECLTMVYVKMSYSLNFKTKKGVFMLKKFFVFSLLILLVGCASVSSQKASEVGYTFQSNGSREDIIGAIVATLNEDSVAVTNINEKYGIVSTGEQEVSSEIVDSKWFGQPNFGFNASRKVDLGFTVSEDGKVKMKICYKIKSPWTGAPQCSPYGLDNANAYFERSIKEKL